MRIDSFRVLPIMLFALALASCAPKPAVRIVEPLEAIEGPITVDALKESILFEDLKSVASEVKVKVSMGEKKLGTFKGIFAYAHPGFLSLSVFDPFGFTAVEVAASGHRVQIHVPASNVLYEGRMPSIGLTNGLLLSKEEKNGGIFLYAFRAGQDSLELERKYTFSRYGSGFRNTGSYVYKDGRVFIGMEFGAYSGKLPRMIRMSFINGFTAEIELLDPDVDADIPVEYFAPFGHEGKRVLPLESLRRAGGGS